MPVDLTDAIVLAQIRDKPGGTVFANLACNVMDPGNIIIVSLDAFDSNSVIKSGVWDMQITFPNTEVQTILKGKVRLTNDVMKVSTHS